MRNKILKCGDLGTGCQAEFRGPTVDHVLEQAKKHGMESHGLTKEQVDSEPIMKMAAAKTRDEDGS